MLSSGLLFRLLLYPPLRGGLGRDLFSGAAVPVFPTRPRFARLPSPRRGWIKSASTPRRQRRESLPIGGQRIAAPNDVQVGPHQDEIVAVNVAGPLVAQ